MDQPEIIPTPARAARAEPSPDAIVTVHETIGDHFQAMTLAAAGRFAAEYTGLLWTIEQTQMLGHVVHHAATRNPFWQLALSERSYADAAGPGRQIPLGVARAAANANAARAFLFARFALSTEERRARIPVRVLLTAPTPTA